MTAVTATSTTAVAAYQRAGRPSLSGPTRLRMAPTAAFTTTKIAMAAADVSSIATTADSLRGSL